MDTAQTASGQPENRQKRRLVPIIDARFQWKYTLVITALGVGITAIMGGFLYRAHITNTRVLELSPELRAQVAENDQLFLLYLIVAVLAMAVALTFWGIVVTHRISGPLYIVARHLRAIANGSYPDVRPLRKRDELHEFFATFEGAITRIKNRDVQAAAEFKEALEKDDFETLKAVVARHQAELERALQGDG
jgi:nitrogen fixation/metabolism regulation signal transduction histidine kinase